MRTSTWRRWGGGALLGALVVGPIALVAGTVGAGGSRPSPADLERLHQLGYEPWVEEAKPPRRTGVVDAAPGHAGGFVLFANRGACSAQLIDRDGAVVHSWSGPVRGFWADTELLPDGTLLVVGADSTSRARQHLDRYLRRLDRDGSVLWESDFPAHHDVERLADGSWLTLSSEVRDVVEDGKTLRIVDELVTIVEPDGHVRESHSLYDAFAATPEIDIPEIHLRGVRIAGTFAVDAFHANSVEWIDRPDLVGEHPLYAPGNVLVSLRHQSTVVVLDRRAGELLWAWGNGVVDAQHSARMLDNGNILIFDNGLARGRSRVVEVDPRRDEVVWEFSGPDPKRFFTKGGGAAQRLPNGNTLVTETGKGRLFEVTKSGRTVWAYVNPVDDPQRARRATIHASKWLPEGDVASFLGKAPQATGGR